MTAAAAPDVIANPFSTRFTRPGCVAPLDAKGEPLDVAGLVALLRAAGGRAAIVGPHGTGKTTLLLAMAERLAATDSLAGNVRLRCHRDVVGVWRAIRRAPSGSILCVDSWERAGLVGRAAAVLARWRGCGLLVTSHRSTGLKTLVHTAGSLPLLAAVVARVPDHGGVIRESDIAAAHRRHGGNIRESLYDLYDRFESRRP